MWKYSKVVVLGHPSKSGTKRAPIQDARNVRKDNNNIKAQREWCSGMLTSRHNMTFALLNSNTDVVNCIYIRSVQDHWALKQSLVMKISSLEPDTPQSFTLCILVSVGLCINCLPLYREVSRRYHLRKGGTDRKSQRQWVTTTNYCFPDTAGQFCMWARSGNDSRHGTCTRSNQKRIPARRRKWSGNPTPGWGGANYNGWQPERVFWNVAAERLPRL